MSGKVLLKTQRTELDKDISEKGKEQSENTPALHNVYGISYWPFPSVMICEVDRASKWNAHPKIGMNVIMHKVATKWTQSPPPDLRESALSFLNC